MMVVHLPAAQPTVDLEQVPPTAIARDRPPLAAVPVTADAWSANRLPANKKAVVTGVEKYPEGTGEQTEAKQYDPAKLERYICKS